MRNVGVSMKRVIGKRSPMIQSVSAVRTMKEDPRARAFEEMAKLFSAAANSDALKIFYAAEGGITNSTHAIKEMGLTQKRYYTHLKRLIDVGLIEKVEGAYRHTTLGKICYKMAEALSNTLSYRERLNLIDKLTKAKNISLEESEEIMRAILKDMNIVPGERLSDIIGPVKMADTWDKVVTDVIEYINKAEESIHFATQYLDSRVVEAIFMASQRGVELNFLITDKDQVSTGLKILIGSLFTNPRALRSLVQLFMSPKLKVRTVELPYTFIVVDRSLAMVEVVKPYTKKFSLAFFFHNRRLCERLIESFNVLWDRGTEIKTLFDRFLKEKAVTI